MPVTDKPIPRWQKLTALVYAIAWIVVIVLTWGRLGADLWPPDRSTLGPNFVASIVQATIIVIFAALLWPPFRKRLEHLAGHAIHQSRLLEELHFLHHEGAEHPRVVARRSAGQGATAEHGEGKATTGAAS